MFQLQVTVMKRCSEQNQICRILDPKPAISEPVERLCLSREKKTKYHTTRTTQGDRSFTAAGPHLWNNLPLHLRDFELSLSEFRRLLKTHLFG